jgi:hypothetical protein
VSNSVSLFDITGGGRRRGTAARAAPGYGGGRRGNVSGMASIEDVARLAARLPEVTDGEDKFGHRSWAVAGKGFGWIRQFSKADIKRFGSETPPEGPILALRVADLQEKEAILAGGTPGFFTIPHFNGYQAYLVQLTAVADSALAEALEDAWLSQAPPALAERYLAEGRRH